MVCEGFRKENEMKNILMVVLIAGSIIAEAEASFYVESLNKVVEGGVIPVLIFCPTHNLNKQFKQFQLQGFSMTSENYAEGYVGLGYSPKPWLQVGVSFGLETADNPWRVAASIWAGKGSLSLLCVCENGGSGYWYDIKPTVKVNNWLTVGFMAKRFSGVGPFIQVGIPNTPLKAYLVPAYDFEDSKQKTSVGICLSL